MLLRIFFRKNGPVQRTDPLKQVFFRRYVEYGGGSAGADAMEVNAAVVLLIHMGDQVQQLVGITPFVVIWKKN